ncbi:MAG: HAMP domain-containing histidine kinase [Saprospirales bacterium]|nr:HAMP domain-containing histidine kinase [Saprospirales bacterium]
MSRSSKTAILILALLVVFATLFRGYSTSDRHLHRYARKIERFLQEREIEAGLYTSQVSFSPAIALQEPVLEQSWGLAPFNIAWYAGDSLLFSLHNRFLPENSPPEGATTYFLQKDRSTTYIGKRVSGTGAMAVIWLPLWTEYAEELPYLKNGFTGIRGIPEGIIPNTVVSDFPILGAEGLPIAYLHAEEPFQDPLAHKVFFWLFLGIAGTLAFLAHQIALALSARYSPWWGLFSLVVFMVGMRLLLNPFLMAGPEGSVLPDLLLKPIEQQTLGGLLLNTFFLLWLMLFFYQKFEDLRFPAMPKPFLILLIAANYLAIILGMLLIAQTIRNIVLYSSLNVYLENLFAVNTGGMLAIAALILLFLSFFLFSHRMGRVIVNMGLRPAQRMLALGLSLVAAVPFYFWANIPFPLELFVLAEVVYLGALDYFSDTESPNLTWLIVWLVIFSGFTAMLLSSFHLEKEEKIQQELTIRLSSGGEGLVGAPIRTGSFESLFQPVNPGQEAEYAIYHLGVLAEKSPSGNFPLEERGLVGIMATDTLIQRAGPGRIDWIYANSTGDTAVVSREVSGIMRPISVFSYLLALFILIIPLLAIFNYWFRFLPYHLDFTQLQKPTLSNRIQFWVVGFLLISFLIIGVFSIWNFRQTANYNQEVQIKDKIDAIREDAHLRIRQAEEPAALFSATLPDVGRLHQMDLMIYDSTGHLGGSTFSRMLEKELAPTRLNGATYYRLTEGGKSFDLQAEQTGELRYRTAYFPILLEPGAAPFAFIGLPFAEQASLWQQELSGFISTLINVYVFLLLLAGAVAIFIANSITEPISQLGDSLRRLDLGENEPLTYTRKDELGALIEEYNRMLEKLAESTQKLAESERDSAWREMARQVAHEIKNPLTPMQLGIQQLQHTLATQPEKATQMFHKVSKTIVEEIENLKDIANSFSNFAKMPVPENSLFSLNELVDNVHTLFMHGEVEFDITLRLPEQACYVLADRNHLRRVFTNIYKNAIQAFTEDRRGKVDTQVFLHQKMVVIKIGDNGSGIPEEMREKVFVPNFTTKSSGSGLGMAISKNIIEMAGGRIYFETEQGRGTDFFVELPLVETHE